MKRIFIFFAVSLVVLTVFAVPFFAHAQEATNPISSAINWVADKTGGFVLGAVTSPLRGLLYVFMFVESMLIALAGMLVGAALQFNVTILDFNPPFITIGWQIFRDIANLGFVVGIVVIAIATILRIKGYQAKQVLWRLIVAALVVNFSLLIGGIIIQPANSIAEFILQYITSGPADAPIHSFAASAKLGDAFRFTDILNSMSSWSLLTGGAFDGTTSAMSIIASMVVVALFGAIMFLTLISFAGMLFLRYFQLAFLLMISPIAWLSWIFPGTKKYFKEWWEKFIHWVIYAPFMLLFMYIALRVLDIYAKYQDGIAHDMPSLNSLSGFTSQGTSELNSDLNFGLLMTSLFATAILLGGLKMASKMGHGGTKLALGAVDSGQKFAKKWATDRVRRTGAGALQAPGKLAQKIGYKPGTIQASLSKAGAWGKSPKPFLKQTLGEKTKTVLSGMFLGSTRYVAKEAAIGMGEASTKLKTIRGEDIDDQKKRLTSLPKEQQDALMAGLSQAQRAAVIELQAKENKLNEKTLSAFKSADEKRDAMIEILKKMADDKRKDLGNVEKKIAISKDMLIAQRDGRAIVFERDDDDPTKIIKKEKTFEDLAPGFFEKYSADDWKNYSSNLGSKMYGDKPSHPLGDNVMNSIDPKIMDRVMNPRSPAFQSIMSRLPAKQQGNFYDKVKNELEARKPVMGKDYELMLDKMRNVQKHLTSFISPDKDDEKEKAQAPNP